MTTPTSFPLPHPATAMAGFSARGVAEPLPRWETTQLFGPRNNEVEIEHRGAIYRLRITSLGKLILTK